MTSRRRFLGTTAVVGGISAASPAFSARSSIRYDELEARVTRRDFKNLHKEDLPTPCMVVDLEIFEKNLKTMADHCRTSGIHLRGHVKVHKSPDIAKRQVALGSIGVTCATIAEAELMSHSGITGVLLTRQPTSKNNINRAVMLAKRDPTFATVVDDPLTADWLQEAAAHEGVKLRVAVDVYAGLTRHGIEAGEPAVELAKKVNASKNLKLIGLMGYSGVASHTHGWTERKKKSQEDLSGLMESVALAAAAPAPTTSIRRPKG
jgi:D-serine deaminase-like pyridoxal phosphate-dependent protein